MRERRQGLVQVYQGTGKGKTTAALGLALRASGFGLRTCFIQFMKESTQVSGEVEAIKGLKNIDIFRFGESFIANPPEAAPAIKKRISDGLDFAKEVIIKGEYNIVVLDEINVALHLKVAELEDVLKLVRLRDPEVELVLTDRYPPQEILEMADLITDMDLIKHPYDEGIGAREGVEY